MQNKDEKEKHPIITNDEKLYKTRTQDDLISPTSISTSATNQIGEIIEVAPTALPSISNDKNNNDNNDDNKHVHLTWRSWVVVLVACFALMAQVFVVTAAGSVIAFIARDLGGADISGWVIQGPLLMQCVLSPIIGRLSDLLDRKYLAAIPPLIAAAGAITSARANSMDVLVGGGILNGAALATIAITQSIPSEVLPMKYRVLSNGLSYVSGACGIICGGLLAGGLTSTSRGGWRSLFWVEAGLHLTASLGLFLFYHPPRKSDYPRMSVREYIWACDPIGCSVFVAGATLILLALNWAGTEYAWSDAHVAAVLSIGLVLLGLFGIYEWKGRSDGLVAHALFQGSPNFALAVFAFTVEGWLYFSPINTIIQQLTLHMGFSSSSWVIAVRQLSCTVTAPVISLAITYYATKYKDLKTPLVVTLFIFLAGTICYTVITPEMKHAQIGFNILLGAGISGSLGLLVATVQFTAPHSHLSTATGLAFSFRAIGGAFGSAVENAIIQGTLYPRWTQEVSHAATTAGLPASSIPSLLQALSTDHNVANVPGANATIIARAERASQGAYAHAYHRAWACLIPLIVLALVAVSCLKDVKHLMTEKIEATVERERGQTEGAEG